MSCESCIAARHAETAALLEATSKAQSRATELNIPIYILRTPNGYEISDTPQPNAIEVKLPGGPVMR